MVTVCVGGVPSSNITRPVIKMGCGIWFCWGLVFGMVLGMLFVGVREFPVPGIDPAAPPAPAPPVVPPAPVPVDPGVPPRCPNPGCASKAAAANNVLNLRPMLGDIPATSFTATADHYVTRHHSQL